MDKLEFEYPADFIDDMEVQAKPELPPFKASAVLYSVSAIALTLSFLVVMIDLASRGQAQHETLVDMVEWNAFSQLGTIGALNGLLFFWLGIMTDRRGA